MKKVPLKKRLYYWFDNRVAGGSFGLIWLLTQFTLIIILVIALIIFILGLNEEGGFLAAFWESLSTIINAWMPSYEDGSIGYLIMMSIAAIVGLFVTSILIGIISSGIEEKITSLKRGNSEVIEEGHILVLGFYAGEYTLLKQLILAAADSPCCIVVAGDMEQEEMQTYIRDNVEIPPNVRIVCRTIDIFDPKALEKCAVSSCKSVIISPTDDFTTTKALLAVSTIIHEEENDKVRVGAIVSRPEYRFPPSIAAKHNVTTLQTNETLAKIIAHSCTEPGLSDSFRELFNFEGSELYSIDLPEAVGLSFGDLMLRMTDGVPMGIICGTAIQINPPGETVIGEGDKLLVFAETKSSAKIVKEAGLPDLDEQHETSLVEADTRVTIIGGGSSLSTVLRELPDNVTEIILCRTPEGYQEVAAQISAERQNQFKIATYEGDLNRSESLLQLARLSEHIVILSDPEVDEEEADMANIFLLLNLRDIRTRYGLDYNITAEMRRENNQSLVATGDNTDFVVASNMSSLFLAQLSESPELIGAFSEILSNKGNELYLKEACLLHCEGEKTTAEIRRLAYRQGYIVLGYRLVDRNESFYNPSLDEKISLGPEDQLIVLGES